MTFLLRLTDLPEGNENIASDFEKRYLSTYLQQYMSNGERRIIYFEGRSGSNYQFWVPSDNSRFLFQPKLDEDLDIRPLLPDVGYYNVQGHPKYLYKVPQKQYKRSFCSSTYTIAGAGMTREGNSWTMMAQTVLDPMYAKLDEITKKLFSYIALTPKFAIQENDKGRSQLLYRQYPVGVLHFKERAIEVIQPTMYQEVMDLFKSTGVQTWKLK